MPLISTKELAIELGLTPKQVRKLALSGRIPALRFNSEWRFDLAAVLAAAAYVDHIAADARQAARKTWMQPRRLLVRPALPPKKKGAA